MAFWKPGAAAPGLGVGAGVLDRETEQETSFVIGNTYKNLSIFQQRVQLPIFACRTPLHELTHFSCSPPAGDQILYLIEKFSFVILIGATGSGKTTRTLSFCIIARR